MKTERWFLLVVVLLIVLVGVFVAVTQISNRPVTGNVAGFTCPDGSVVDSEEDCDEEDLFDSLAVEPTEIDLDVGIGDDVSSTFVILNNHDFPVYLQCDFSEMPWLEPEATCLANVKGNVVASGGNFSLPAGETLEYTVRVYTHEDALLIQNGSKFYFTTHTGIYFKEIVLSAWRSGEEADEFRIPLRIEVIE